MAMGDYRWCAVCDGKAFYYADLQYTDKRQLTDINGQQLPDMCGALIALCERCAGKHEINVSMKEHAARDPVTHESRCPHCLSVNVRGGVVDIDSNEARQQMDCHGCGEGWTDVYRLVHVGGDF